MIRLDYFNTFNCLLYWMITEWIAWMSMHHICMLNLSIYLSMYVKKIQNVVIFNVFYIHCMLGKIFKAFFFNLDNYGLCSSFERFTMNDWINMVFYGGDDLVAILRCYWSPGCKPFGSSLGTLGWCSPALFLFITGKTILILSLSRWLNVRNVIVIAAFLEMNVVALDALTPASAHSLWSFLTKLFPYIQPSISMLRWSTL